MRIQKSLKREQVARLITVSLILTACVFIILTVKNMLVTLVIALVINYLLAPFVNALERRGFSRSFGISLLYVLIGMGIILSISFFLPVITAQAASFKKELPKFIEGTTQLIARWENKLNAGFASFYTIELGRHIETFFSSVSKGILKGMPNMVSDMMTILTVFIMAPFFAFFMLLDGKTVSKKLLSLVPNNLFEIALTLHHQINRQIGGFIRARILEAGIVGLVVLVGMHLIDFPYGTLLALFAALTNLIPYVGPFIGAIPAVIIALVNGLSGFSWIMMVSVYLSGQLIDMLIIIPLVVAKIVNLHPVSVIIVIIIGAQLLGILGMIISIPVFCIIKLITTTCYLHFVELR